MRIFILTLLLLITQNSCKQDCIEPMGSIIQQEVDMPFFDKIIVNTGVELVIKQSAERKIVIETGENRFDNVHYHVLDEVLELQADDSCIFSANLDPVKIYVNSPTLTSIRNSSEYTIKSDGVLTYSNLTLLVEDDENEYLNIGNFNIQLNNSSTKVISNGISNIYLSGSTENLEVLYYNGIGRFEGENLEAQQVHVFHRAENSIKINPQERLTGDIFSIGNIISYNHPPIVEVTEHYEGRLIFE